MVTGVWRDLVHAGKSLAKARAFTFVCVVSLGIGMAPVIAVPYLARITRTPPPGVRTEGLVEVFTTALGPHEARDAWSYPDFADLRAAETGMALSGWVNRESRIAIQTPAGVEAKSASTMFVSANYFQTTGVRLLRGPGFDAAMDDPLRAEPVVIVGYTFWQTQLGADPDIVGKTLTLDEIRHVVVGIAPEHFEGHLFLHMRELFVPLEQHPFLRDRSAADKVRSDRSNEWIFVVGHLMPGAGISQASAAVSAVTSQLARQYPATNELKAGTVAAYHPSGNLHRTQFVALQAVALTLTGTVLVVVCLNISGMVQVRSAMRERELSIRQAVGASRGRLIQYLLSEALILAGLGGALGSLVLFSVPSVLAWRLGRPFPYELQQALRVDLSILAIYVGLCVVTSLVFGLLPAARFSRPAIISSLEDDAGVGGFRAGRMHRVRAALQVAIAVPLIVMSGMSLDRFRATAMSSLGFDADNLYAVPLKLDTVKDKTADSRLRGVEDSVQQVSGIRSVTLADGLPLDFRGRVAKVSLQVGADVAPRFVPAQVTRVGEGYLGTMGIPLLRGRGITVEDRAGAETVTVISKSLADKLLPSADAADAIGKRLTFGAEKTPQTLTVVGVSADFPTSQMSTERAQLLLPLAQQPAPNVFLIARGAAGEPPVKLTAALENAVRDLGPDAQRTYTTNDEDGVAHSGVLTGVRLRQNSMGDFLVQSAVAGCTGGVILMLAALGIYGVIGLMVATRTREIAVRVALGASRRRIIGMILFGVVKLVMPGVVIGLILTVAIVRLNGVNMGIPLSNIEPLAYGVGAAVAVMVAVLASLIPARRAASVQPIVAMRSL